MNDMTLSRLEELSGSAAEAIVLMDEESFRAFYERTSRGLWAYIARTSGDRQLADDLLQEAYYRFYRLGDSHESESHRRNSLYCIATNLMRDAARRRRRGSLVPLPEEDEANTLRSDERVDVRVEGKT